jgi:DNA modification methylase
VSEKKSEDIPTGLYWKGKKTEVDRVVLPFQTIETINESRATREKEKVKGQSLFKVRGGGDWYNRLIWGDNKYIMASLLEEFAGKVDLIYIDPPFATGADFSVKMTLGDAEWTKEPSAIEDKAYRDTWGQGLDSYLQMIYERLVIMRELLSDTGSIYVHLDWHVGHYVKIILDEIFGIESFRNEVIWHYRRWTAQSNQYQNMHDLIYFYSKNREYTFNKIEVEPTESQKKVIEKGYNVNVVKSVGRSIRQLLVYDKKKVEKLIEEKVIDINKYGNVVYIDTKNTTAPDVWTDIQYLHSQAIERVDYSTQKPELLLNRIINVSTSEGDLVADFFCGSGTTGAVAEKLGRRWIMTDLGRYAIHTTRKRLLGIENCKPFVVQNLGKYERQYWQGVTFKKRSDEQIPIYEYIQFILKLYNAEPLTGMMHIHGKKGRSFVHVSAVDVPVTLSEIKEAMDEVKEAGQKALDVLGWEWEMGLHDVVEKTAKENGIHLRLLSIPRDVMDPRATEKGDVTFYELAYLEVEAKLTKDGRFTVEPKDFAIPNLDLIPQEVRDKIKKWSDYIDYWSVDWDWNEDTFHNMWQSYRTRKERKLELTSDPHRYENSGEHKIMVKVIDIFGNDTTHVIEVKL